MKTTADIMEMLSADFTLTYYHTFWYGVDCKVLLARRMQMISLAALMIYDGRW